RLLAPAHLPRHAVRAVGSASGSDSGWINRGYAGDIPPAYPKVIQSSQLHVAQRRNLIPPRLHASRFGRASRFVPPASETPHDSGLVRRRIPARVPTPHRRTHGGPAQPTRLGVPRLRPGDLL